MHHPSDDCDPNFDSLEEDLEEALEDVCARVGQLWRSEASREQTERLRGLIDQLRDRDQGSDWLSGLVAAIPGSSA